MAFVIGSVDENKQEKGIWVELSNSKFLVAYSGNTEYIKIATRLRKPYERAIKKGTIDAESLENVLCKAMAQGLLLDWKNVTDVEGNQVPYSEEMAESALKNDPDFRAFILETAENLEAFRKDDIKATAKK